MGQSISLQLNRNLSIAPALQKSLQLLQMNALEFEQEINQALDSNPLLEMEEPVDGHADSDAAAERADLLPPDRDPGQGDVDDGFPDGADAVDSYAEMMRDAPSGDDGAEGEHAEDYGPADDGETGPGVDTVHVDAAGDEFNESLTDWSTASKSGQGEGLSALDLAPSHSSLRDHLYRQLGSLRLSPLEQALCGLVIDSLDPAGYLREADDELAEMARDAIRSLGKGRIAIDSDDVSVAVSRIQSFDPAGIAARSFDECLRLQLRDVSPATPGRATALAIVAAHLPLLAQNDFRGIAAETGASEAELSAATQLIRSLDPKPGLAFGKDRVVFAVPEVIVRKVKGVWTAGLHPAATPRIRINAQYADIVARNEGGQCNGLSSQLQEAKWLLRSIEQRASTIERTADAIVARQQAFFEHGDIGLKPLRLADIAADVGIHESTVSRVVNSKYLQCPAGLIPLRKFFTSHVETSAGNACSATAVKAMIRQLVDAESTGEPLSDHRLAKLLTLRGIRIARRTVTKYSDAMGIEAADLRRHLNQSSAEEGPPSIRRTARVSSTRRVARPTEHSAHA